MNAENPGVHTHIIIAGGIFLLALFSTMIALFFFTSNQQTIISDNQRRISHFYLNWMVLKEELYISEFEQSDYYELIIRLSAFKTSINEVFVAEELNTVRLREEKVKDSFTAIYIKWPYLEKGLQQLISDISFKSDPDRLHSFFTSPLVESFEQDLMDLDREIYNISRNQLRRFQLLNNLIVIFLLLLLFGLVLFFYYIRQRNKSSEGIRTLTQSLLKVHEEEKKQIAYNLHDDIIQDMASLKIQLENLIDPGTEGKNIVPDDLKPISSSMQEIIQATRRISGTIRPYNLEHLGLVGAIRVMCNNMAAQTSIHIQFRPVGMDRIRSDYTTQINLYRITQEALRNIRKHSTATQAVVRIIASSPHIIVRVQDNCKGFNLAQLRSGISVQEDHIGLTSMEERTRLLHGQIHITSAPGKGTEIKVTVPAQYQSESTPRSDLH